MKYLPTILDALVKFLFFHPDLPRKKQRNSKTGLRVDHDRSAVVYRVSLVYLTPSAVALQFHYHCHLIQQRYLSMRKNFVCEHSH